MPGLWRFEKAGTTVQIAPSDGDNLLTVISKDEHGSYLSLFEIVDAGHVRIIRSTSTGNLARVKIAPSGRSMIIDQGNYPGEGTAKYIRIK